VGQFQIDSGAAGGAFGLAVQTDGDVTRFAAVDDNTNTLNIFTFDPPLTGGAQGQQSAISSMVSSSGMQSTMMSNSGMQSTTTSTSTSGMQTGSSGLISMIDMVLQDLNAEVTMIETRLLAVDPQLSMGVQMFNSMLETLETDISGHPIGGL
jgi:hypothetical protein